MTDSEYVTKRNKLIPEAKKYANERYGFKFFGEDTLGAKKNWGDKWDRAYLGKMDDLAKEWGLVG